MSSVLTKEDLTKEKDDDKKYLDRKGEDKLSNV